MLVLSRKKNEVIRVSDDITIVVIEIRGDKVRLGVEAPRNTSVHRGEVYDAIQRQNLAARLEAAKREIGEPVENSAQADWDDHMGRNSPRVDGGNDNSATDGRREGGVS